MSVIQKAIQYLDGLYRADRNIDAIELEFRQLSEIEPLLNLLNKFRNLRKISFHGNRIKHLPNNMDPLQFVEELDISNNNLSNVEDVIACLKTMPNLRRLVCPFRKDEQVKLKKQLTKLEYINNSKIQREKPKPKAEIVLPNRYEINADDLDAVTRLHEKINILLKDSYEVYNHQAARDEFADEQKQIMTGISSVLKNNNDPNFASAVYLNAKYNMYKKCQEKVLNLLEDIDDRYHQVVSQVYAEYVNIIMSLIGVVTNPVQIKKPKLMVEQTDTEKIENKVARYEKELRRMRREKQEYIIEMKSFEQENRRMIEAMVMLSKQKSYLRTSAILGANNNNINRPNQSFSKSGRQQNSQSRQHKHSTFETKEIINQFSMKGIPLKQLKDLIQEIYESKTKFDLKCFNMKQSHQTMHQFLFTFLNQKYGLKNLTIQWVSYIVAGIQNYSQEDNDVAVFGKVLRNQCEQDFRLIQKETKAMVIELLRNHIKAKNQYRTNAQINEILQDKIQREITNEECEDIVHYLYDQDQSNQILDKIKLMVGNRIAKSKKQNSPAPGRRFSRTETSADRSTQISRPKLHQVVKCILDKQLKKHEKTIRPLLNKFKLHDSDNDGAVTQKEFNAMLSSSIEDSDRLLSKLLIKIDPNHTNKITLSQVLKVLWQEPSCKILFDLEKD